MSGTGVWGIFRAAIRKSPFQSSNRFPHQEGEGGEVVIGGRSVMMCRWQIVLQPTIVSWKQLPQLDHNGPQL